MSHSFTQEEVMEVATAVTSWQNTPKVFVDALVVLHMLNKTKSKRELTLRLTIPKADLPPVKVDTMRTVLSKHAMYIENLISIHGRKRWPKDWFNYSDFEFAVVDVTDCDVEA